MQDSGITKKSRLFTRIFLFFTKMWHKPRFFHKIWDYHDFVLWYLFDSGLYVYPSPFIFGGSPSKLLNFCGFLQFAHLRKHKFNHSSDLNTPT